MARRRGTNLVVAVLAVTAGVLAWLDFHLLQTPVDVSPVAPPPARTEVRPQRSPPPATALDKKTPEQFQEAVDRPLFNPGRKPVQRSQTATRAPKMAPARLRLVGVMKPDDGPPRALIRFADEPAGRWIAEGDEYHGWTLTKVNDGSVTVKAGGAHRGAHALHSASTTESGPGRGAESRAGPDPASAAAGRRPRG